MSLERRTPLNRGAKGLTRTPFRRKSPPTPAKRTRVKPVSNKRVEENRIRSKLRDLLLRRDGPACAWPLGCRTPWQDMHEVFTRARSGGSITDLRIIIGLCRHHNGVATDTRPAECIGVVVPSWAAEQDLEGAMATAVAIRQGLADGGTTPCPWRRNGQPCSSPVTAQRSRCDDIDGYRSPDR